MISSHIYNDLVLCAQWTSAAVTSVLLLQRHGIGVALTVYVKESKAQNLKKT